MTSVFWCHFAKVGITYLLQEPEPARVKLHILSIGVNILNMSIESEALADRRVVESRLGRILGIASRIGGAAITGYAGYLFGRNGYPELALAIPGIGSMVGGVRLGLERGAALERIAQREQFDGQVVVGISDERKEADRIFTTAGVKAGPFVELATATMAGAEIAVGNSPGGFPFPFELGTAAMAVGAAAWVETAIQQAGQTTEVKPRLHQALHLS